MLRRFTTIFALFFVLSPLVFAQEDVTLEPSKDNTLFQSSAGTLSNGAGDHLFAGTTDTGAIRRAVVAFNLDGALPDDAEIQSVSLELNMSRTISGAHSTSLHRLTADWGEGTSVAAGEEGGGANATEGDATWIHRFHDTESWAAVGGDFDATASAAFDVSGLGAYSVSSEAMADDVRAWIADPSSNFGWILIGDESTERTAKRFDSRENGGAANRPRLTITYMTTTAAEHPDVPRTFNVTGNYPNPFTRSTTIHFDVERPQDVSLTLYDVLGREVQSLVRGYVGAGRHEVAVHADGLPAGTYLYCFAGRGNCGRMMLLP